MVNTSRQVIDQLPNEPSHVSFLLAACLMPFVYGMSSWLYLLVALVLSLVFVAHAVKLWRKYSDEQARKTFKFSLVHLRLLFAAMLIDHYLF